jgi:hypothetical protein
MLSLTTIYVKADFTDGALSARNGQEWECIGALQWTLG